MRIPQPWKRVRRGVTYWYVTLGGRQYLLGVGDSPDDRERVQRAYIEVMGTRVPKPSSWTGPLVSVIVAAYLDDCEGRTRRGTMRASTLATYTHYLRRWVASLPLTLTIDHLSETHVTRWLDRSEGMGPSGRWTAITVVKGAFAWAHRAKKISVNHLTDLRPPPKPKRVVVIHPEDLGKLIREAPQYLRDVITIASQHGLRPDEVRRIEARHIDQKRSTVTLPPREHKTGGKTGAPRVIYMTAEAMETLSRLMERYPEGPIFRNERGGEWSKDSLARAFRRHADRLGIDKRATMYALRHNFATRALVQAGLDAGTVAALLGHTSAKMVLDTYQHARLLPELMQDAAKRASRSVSEHSRGRRRKSATSDAPRKSGGRSKRARRRA